LTASEQIATEDARTFCFTFGKEPFANPEFGEPPLQLPGTPDGGAHWELYWCILYIRAVLYVERESQKGIVIGEGGRTIKTLGAAARTKIEGLLGGRVYLDLHVKVLPKWRRDEPSLKRLGYATS